MLATSVWSSTVFTCGRGHPHVDGASNDPAPVMCALGDEIGQSILSSRGFQRVNFARDKKQQRKIGWEARHPNSVLTLCPQLPSGHRAPERRPTKEAAEWPYMLALGLQGSHVRTMPLMGIANVSC